MTAIRVLHVEDSDEIIRPAREVMRSFGWTVEVARSVEQAQTTLARDPAFDAAIVDRYFDGSAKLGDELVRWIQSTPSLQHLCVVMLTHYGSAPRAVDALRAGVWQFLEKPQKFRELRELLLVGVAWKKCHRVRSELFSIATRAELHTRVADILSVLGLDTPHIFIVRDDGKLADLLGDVQEGSHRFVAEVLRGQAFELHGNTATMLRWEPISSETRSVLAVPIRGLKGSVIGLVVAESARDQKLPAYWRDFLVYIADLIGLALLRMQMERAQVEAERARYKQLELVYHELRHTIASHAQTIALHVAKLDEQSSITPERIRVIRRNAEAIEAAIRGLRDATDELFLDKSTVDLQELLSQAVEDISKTLPNLVTISVDSVGAYPWLADAHWMRECFLCLLQNAAESIEERRRQDLDYLNDAPETIAVSLTISDDGPIISFKDSGIGFSPSASELLFQPLFSTKTTFPAEGRQETLGIERLVDMLETTRRQLTTSSDAKGALRGRKGFEVIVRDVECQGGSTVCAEVRHGAAAPLFLEDDLQGELRHGFGLYTVRRVVQQHNGTIHAVSAGPFKGAEFVIRLYKPDFQPAP